METEDFVATEVLSETSQAAEPVPLPPKKPDPILSVTPGESPLFGEGSKPLTAVVSGKANGLAAFNPF